MLYRFTARIRSTHRVICCNPGKEEEALEAMRKIIHRMGLSLNEAKTKTHNLGKKGKFDFLGYTIGTYYNKDGNSYIGTCPSQKALKKVLQKIHRETERRLMCTSAISRIKEM